MLFNIVKVWFKEGRSYKFCTKLLSHRTVVGHRQFHLDKVQQQFFFKTQIHKYSPDRSQRGGLGVQVQAKSGQGGLGGR